MPPTGLPLIVYVRVSKRNEEEGRQRSPEDQVSRATKFATDNGFPVGRTISDLGVSGAVHPLERPGMAETLQEIEAGRAGGVVAFDMSRLSREPSHLEWLAAWMTKQQASMLWYGMPADPHSPIGELQIGLVAQIDRYQRRQSGERFKMAAEAAVLRGIPRGPVPIGYRQREDRTLEPDPETAPLVRDVYERRIQGEGWGPLALWLTERTGRTWSRRGVSHIIENPLYRTGRITSGGVTSEVDAGALVDEATWQAAQSPKIVRDGRTTRAKCLLAGLLRCDVCGRVLIHWWPSKDAVQSNRARRYRCNGLHCTSKVTVHGPIVEDMVVQEAFAVDLKLIAQPQEAPDLVPLEEALTKAERRFEQVQTPEAMDALGEAWAATVKARRTERDEAAATLGAARTEAGVSSEGGQVLRLGHIWDDLTPDQQREALHWTFQEVRVRKVARGQKPSLKFVTHATRPYGSIEYRPPAIEQQ